MIVIQNGFVAIEKIAQSSDGRVAVVGRTVQDRFAAAAWDSATAAELVRDADDATHPFNVLFEPGTQRLVFGVRATRDKIPDVPNDYLTLGLPEFFRTGPFAASPDGSRLVVSESGYGVRASRVRKVRMFGFVRQAETEWRQVWVWTAAVQERSLVQFVADGIRVLSIEWPDRGTVSYRSWSPPTLALYDFEMGQRFDEVVSRHPIDEITFCGKQLLFRSGTDLYRREVSDVLDKFSPVRLEVDPVNTLAADPHGNFLLTASGSSVSAWDSKTWTVARTYDWKAGAITCLAVAPDGLTAAAGTATGKVVVWDVE